MTIAFLIGRIIFGLYWLEVAYGHLFKSAGLIGYAQSKGVKSPKLAVFGSGVLALIGGATMILGTYPGVGVIAIVLFLLGVSFRIHPYWKTADPMAKMGERINFNKNMAILAAALMFLAIAMPWPYSLGW
ncbi:MAG: DoxX family membrane protein [Patescibacteria group bacterium]|nr:DoxX family membrane protein [Patescibacteria group bacterium]